MLKKENSKKAIETLKPSSENRKVILSSSGEKSEDSKLAFDMLYCKEGSYKKTYSVFTSHKKDAVSKNLKIQFDLTDSFLVGSTPITQRVWKYVMGFNPSYFKSRRIKVKTMDFSDPTEPLFNKGSRKIKVKKNLDRPVESITWFDALMFCNKLSELQGLDPYYRLTNIEYGDKNPLTSSSSNPSVCTGSSVKKTDKSKNRHIKSASVDITYSSGYRLPTNSEWEFIKETTKFPKIKHTGFNTALFKDEDFCTKTVGKGKASSLGLYDFGQNVFEMVYDLDIVIDQQKLSASDMLLDPFDQIGVLRALENKPLSYLNKKIFEGLKKSERFYDPATCETKGKDYKYEKTSRLLVGSTNYLSKFPKDNLPKDEGLPSLLASRTSNGVGFRVARNASSNSSSLCSYVDAGKDDY